MEKVCDCIALCSFFRPSEHELDTNREWSVGSRNDRNWALVQTQRRGGRSTQNVIHCNDTCLSLITTITQRQSMERKRQEMEEMMHGVKVARIAILFSRHDHVRPLLFCPLHS
jgi:hypothetical protein